MEANPEVRAGICWSDTWEFDGNDWHGSAIVFDRSQQNEPSFAMCFDDSRRMKDGISMAGWSYSATNDTWEYYDESMLPPTVTPTETPQSTDHPGPHGNLYTGGQLPRPFPPPHRNASKRERN